MAPAPNGKSPDLARVRALFARAIEHPQAQRAALLQAEAGDDPALLAEVQQLCAAHAIAETRHLMAMPDPALQAPDASGQPQPVAIGPYRVQRQLGSGGMGDVYVALDPRLGREVAVKVLAPHLRAQEAATARFLREARTAAALSHPGIGKVHEVCDDGAPIPWFSMELVHGVPLDAALRTLRTRHEGATHQLTAADLRAALGIEVAHEPASRSYCAEATELIAAVARALAHAHERGVVHRDVKPHNILVRPDGQPVLVDFGLARTDGDLHMTRPGDFVGTPLYASPEQVSARRLPVDHRTDVYSLGATLFELIALDPPFAGETTAQLLRDIEFRVAPSLRARRANTPRDLDAICAMALAKEPQHRYPTAHAFADDLERFAAGQPVVARPIRAWTRVARWSRRRPTAAAVVVLSALLVAMLAAGTGVLQAHAATNRALATANYTSARRWLSEGDMDAALADAAIARELGHADESALLLTEFEAHAAKGEFAKAMALLARITTPPREPALAARLLLLRGDFAVDRVLDADAGLDAVAAAHATGQLDAADAAYAECLLAKDIETAWRHVQRALDAAPGHRHAGLAATWLALGRGDAAGTRRLHADFMRRFPNDIARPLLDRAVGLLDDRATTEEPDAEPDDDSRSLVSATLFVEALEALQGTAYCVGELQQLLLSKQVLKVLPLVRRLAGLAQRARRLQQQFERVRSLTSPAGFALHPVLARAWCPLLFENLPALIDALRRGDTKGQCLPLLANCQSHIDDGFFHLLRGFVHGAMQDHLTARHAFVRAIERPSLMHMQRHALRIAITLDAGFAAGVIPGLARTDVAADLERNVLALLVHPDLDDAEWDQAVSSALLAENWPLANRIAADWQRLAPGSVLAMKAEMDLAWRQGDLLRARRVALAALAIDASLWWAQQVRDEVDAALPR